MSETKDTVSSQGSKSTFSRRIADRQFRRKTCEQCSQSSGYQRWIQCADCRFWSHCNCVRIYDETIIERYQCQNCCADRGKDKRYGECYLKRITNDYRFDPTEYIRKGENKDRVQNGSAKFVEELKKRWFAEPIEGKDIFVLENGYNLEKHIEKNGFCVPIVVKQKDGLNMQVPESFSMQELVEHFGREYSVRASDAYKQIFSQMTLQEFIELTEFSKIPYDSIDALELSSTELRIEPPQALRRFSWTDEAYKHPELKEHRPAVEKYVWISMPNSYIDFQMEFSGTVAWNHMVKGKQKLYFVKPTEENLAIYEKLEKKPKREKFLPDEIKDTTYEYDLVEGDTLLIPPGYPRAYLTYEQTLVLEGNLLCSLRADMQIRIYQMEERLRLKEMLYPNFQLTHWLVIPKVLGELKQLNLSKASCESNPLHSALYTSYRSFVQYTLDYYNQLKKQNEAPRSTGQHSGGTRSTTKNSLNEWETILKHPNLLALNVIKKMLDAIRYEPTATKPDKIKQVAKKIQPSICRGLHRPEHRTIQPTVRFSPYNNRSSASVIDGKGSGVHPSAAAFGGQRIDKPTNFEQRVPTAAPANDKRTNEPAAPRTPNQPTEVRKPPANREQSTSKSGTSTLKWEWPTESIVAFLMKQAESTLPDERE